MSSETYAVRMEFSKMKWITGGLVAASVLMAMSANDMTAQGQDSIRGRGARAGGPGVERIMAMREQLELTDEQLTSLEEMRVSSLAMRNAQMAAMAEMRSQLEAGQIRRSEMMAFMEGRRDAAGQTSEQHRARIDAILTEAQLQTLQESGRREMRSGRFRGRAGMRGMVGRQRGMGNEGGAGWQGRRGDRGRVMPGRVPGRAGSRDFRGMRGPDRRPRVW